MAILRNPFIKVNLTLRASMQDFKNQVALKNNIEGCSILLNNFKRVQMSTTHAYVCVVYLTMGSR